MLETGDETGEAVAWLPAGQYNSDIKETGETIPGVTSCRSYLSIPPSVQLEVPTLEDASGGMEEYYLLVLPRKTERPWPITQPRDKDQVIGRVCQRIRVSPYE